MVLYCFNHINRSQILVCHSDHRCFFIVFSLLLLIFDLVLALLLFHLLLLVLLHDLAHPPLHQFLLQLPHLHVGLDGRQLAIAELAVELFDLGDEVGL